MKKGSSFIFRTIFLLLCAKEMFTNDVHSKKQRRLNDEKREIVSNVMVPDANAISDKFLAENFQSLFYCFCRLCVSRAQHQKPLPASAF